MTVRRLVCRNIADGTGAELFSGRITIDNHYTTRRKTNITAKQ